MPFLGVLSENVECDVDRKIQIASYKGWESRGAADAWLTPVNSTFYS